MMSVNVEVTMVVVCVMVKLGSLAEITGDGGDSPEGSGSAVVGMAVGVD